MTEKYEQRSKKIGFRSQDELIDQINQLGAYQILSVKDTIPASTDGRSWKIVHYLVQI